MTAAPSNALTVIDRVEQSPAVLMLDARASSLLELLPDEAAARRFRRVVTQALVKTPTLLNCTPESVVSAVFEAAAMGLEPTGAAGGAHLVPYGTTAQLILDYRGIIRLVTKAPSDVLGIEARVVKEGDEFAYELGTEAIVRHVPSLEAGRSAKATTHVYALARLRSGTAQVDVEDRAGIERIRNRGRSNNNSPWSTDWDEMAKKTIIKRLAKLLPVRPEVRSILVREDELAGDLDADAPVTPKPEGPSRTARLAARLGASQTAQEPAQAGTAEDLFADEPEGPSLLDLLRSAADQYELAEGPATDVQKAILSTLLKPLGKEAALAGIKAAFGESPTEGQVAAILAVAASLGDDVVRSRWAELVP